MNHKTISKFVLGLCMIASLGLSTKHGHAAGNSEVTSPADSDLPDNDLTS